MKLLEVEEALGHCMEKLKKCFSFDDDVSLELLMKNVEFLID